MSKRYTLEDRVCKDGIWSCKNGTEGVWRKMRSVPNPEPLGALIHKG